MSRDTEIRKTILRLLDAAFPYAQPEDQLLLKLNLLVRPYATEADLAGHLDWLKANQFIGALPGDMGDDKNRWLITEAGQAQNRR